jgi:uncharacterized protein YaiL (DUF2058 family)
MPIILATQEAEIRRIKVQSQPGQITHEPYLEKPSTKIGLPMWLKVQALSSNPSTAKKKKKRERRKQKLQTRRNIAARKLISSMKKNSL